MPLLKLKILDLRGTGVTGEGILEMRPRFPALKVLRQVTADQLIATVKLICDSILVGVFIRIFFVISFMSI